MVRAIEKFAARRRVRRSYHAKAAWTRTRSRCNEEAIDDRQRRRDRSAASGITFATIGAEISAVARIDIMRQREIRERQVYQTSSTTHIKRNTGFRREQVAKDTRRFVSLEYRPRKILFLYVYVDYRLNLLSRVVREAYKGYFHLKIIHSFPFVIPVVCCW